MVNEKIVGLFNYLLEEIIHSSCTEEEKLDLLEICQKITSQFVQMEQNRVDERKRFIANLTGKEREAFSKMVYKSMTLEEKKEIDEDINGKLDEIQQNVFGNIMFLYDENNINGKKHK